MISATNMYIIFIAMFVTAYHETLPSWALTISFISMLAIHIISYASEETLRDKVKELETIVKKEDSNETKT